MMDVATRVSEAMLDRKEDLARAITEALYARRPDLFERYGEAGRGKCVQDMRYNLEHLAPAVALQDPSLFALYARWLGGMLRARGIPADDVRHSLQVMLETIALHFPAEEAAWITPPLRAALAALAEPEVR